MNSGVKIACAVLLVAIVTAAGVGLLVQHRKYDELQRAHTSLEISNKMLVADHAELVSANEKLAGEIRTLRDAALVRATERAALEKERESFEKERVAWERERERLKADVVLAQAAKTRAEKEASGLKASVKDLTASEKKLRGELTKLRGERDKIRKKCEALEHELNEAMQPAVEEELVPVAPASLPKKMTPEERAAHEKEELKDLTDL